MMWQRAKVGAGVVAMGLVVTLGLAVLPVATTTASATIATSAICKAYNAEQVRSTKATNKLDTVMKSGKWPAIQKVLLSTFNTEATSEQQFESLLGGAPAKVKAAIGVSLQVVNKFKSIIQSSKSLTQFENRVTAAENTPKFKAAEDTLDSYTTKACGSTTPTT
jgi:hypothetical protein